ncbi:MULTISPECIES: acyl-CoA dehydrogenase family protein [Janthinobacterium]|jgi:alkylation response protein AidB-like acyl-CoA dehydrogenase|uniref:Acyl-CoA dehydrogenase family protein n=1 Tax=Janthinobacterium kumbetense TaxID=2950280 RepID=A0ABT0WWJ7_9BURK|nr:MULTISPECIES: acyl-CoA dehydrogenase family protein [Janthinobacterium]MCM2568421.1 acyl-CoA dehydrogenase family protein [Janthinobacterium kumbetense]MDN2675060.1 acyl-CoA dehydrogenase family protein [Janthinobacterium sp. SUN026]MDN2680784.1 acyl-CoA dehydrogenase family protein [Janthinobacterium sp. SUN033]MDN2704395.1 acyl-CoA dehydrogenase family protein [Janthinobacterium sp. SUN100]MDN2716689.1 acyl-CoA dehydrogenase family protein [Janthinobacterium sp. SUN120]
MDFELSDEQREFQQAARAFAEGELAPHAAHWDAESIFPVETIAKAGEMGFCGLYTPQRWGGLGLSRQDAAIVFEELAGGCTSTTAYITIHNMATWMLSRWGQEALCDEWVPALAAGQKLASYCLTEPQSGSDAASLRTKAVKEGDFYVLDGTKAFISGAGQTDMLIVMARTGGEGAAGISAFAVPANLPGIVYGKKEEKMGWNSQPTRIISFDQVKVPVGNLLGAEGEGFAIAMKGIDGGRINIAVCSVGTAQAALTRAQAYMKERTQFGRELAQFQALQFKLADMLTELVAARQMVRLAAWKLDQESPDATAYCAMAKRFATDVGFNVANDALQLHGGYGYIREYPLERHVRDTRVHQILEGTNEIMRLIVARAILKDGATETLR